MQIQNRDQKVRHVIIVEGLANLLVLFIKVTVGLATGSLAVLADAVHSLVDVANNVVAWIVIRLSAKPADRTHPYGHRKFETLAVFFLASLLAVLAFELVIKAIEAEESEVISGTWQLLTMLLVLSINLSISLWQRYWAKRLASDILMADASHTFSDVAVTSFIIIGWQLSAMGYAWLDRICALFVGFFIFYLSFKLFKRVIPVLVDEYAVDPEKITQTVCTVPGVQKIQRIRSRWIGSTAVLDMVVGVDANLSTQEAHHIADRIETLIESEFGIEDISIHIEPVAQQQKFFEIK